MRLRAAVLAAALAGAATIAAASGGIEVDAKDLRYDVTGASAKELLDDMLRQAKGVGKEYFANAQWVITWRYDYREPTRGICAIDNLHILLVERTVMPRWHNNAATPALASQWQAFMTGLEAHERGHLEHGRRAADEIRDTLLKMRNRECADLGKTANDTGLAIIRRYAELDVAYDVETGHGTSQGAYWSDGARSP